MRHLEAKRKSYYGIVIKSKKGKTRETNHTSMLTCLFKAEKLAKGEQRKLYSKPFDWEFQKKHNLKYNNRLTMFYNYRIGPKMADLLIGDAFLHLTCLERDLIKDHSPFLIATQSSITVQSATLYQMTTFAWIVKLKARCRYTRLHTVCPLFLHKPTQVYCSAPSTLETIDETFFVPAQRQQDGNIGVTTWVGTTVKLRTDFSRLRFPVRSGWEPGPSSVLCRASWSVLGPYSPSGTAWISYPQNYVL